jgi:hypothetical protein
MIRMLEISDIQLVSLTEARRNPKLNPKISAYEALKPYSNDNSYFISFTTVDKIGINPKSKYDTPLAIYAYPLKAIWKEYNVDLIKSVGKAVPFAGNSPYVWLIKVKNNVNFVKNMYSDYPLKKYESDMKILKNHIISNQKEYQKLLKDDNGNLDTINNTIDSYFSKWEKEAKEWVPIMFMWNITRNLAYYKEGKPMVQWSYLLHRVLGYGGFCDVEGRGHIHPAEPIQACFFSTRSFDVVAEFLNKDYNDEYYWFQKGVGLGIIKVKNADASVMSDYDADPILVWNDGTWISGEWKYGEWRFGTWKDGVWLDGYWKYGTWEKGDWYNGSFLGGTWKDGFWKDGVWSTGVWEDGLWSTGDWYRGTWKNGIWGGGNWYTGTWENGIWEDGTWEYGVWHDGTWKDGFWKDGVWNGGTWKGGTWKDGHWRGGVWENGAWVKGTIYDPDKKGHPLPTDKRVGDYVETKLTPKEYFEGVI